MHNIIIIYYIIILMLYLLIHLVKAGLGKKKKYY